VQVRFTASITSFAELRLTYTNVTSAIENLGARTKSIVEKMNLFSKRQSDEKRKTLQASISSSFETDYQIGLIGLEYSSRIVTLKVTHERVAKLINHLDVKIKKEQGRMFAPELIISVCEQSRW